MEEKSILFEQIRSSGCLSYIVGSKSEKVGVVIDPEIDKTEEYLGLARHFAIELIYAIDTHTHADHSSACKILRDRAGIKAVMHRASEAPYVDVGVDEGDIVRCGDIAVEVLHTPGHTEDSTCLVIGNRIFTGDTLLIGGCGRTDLPGGNAEKQYESLQRLMALGDHLRVYPAHDYRHAVSTLGDEKKSNPRLLAPSKEEFVNFMTNRNPPLPRKIQSALEWNRTPIQGTQRGGGEGI
ncbi:MAG: MBL fold metallo-hydrolase [Deltaproteobacteria bacterium]|nr:MBL fold metallo-hydrolase [Deltaproteobacteria bacterium]